MTPEEKKRLILFRAFAGADEAYCRRLQQTADAEDILISLKQGLTTSQITMVDEVIRAYANLAQCTEETACRYMIFPAEPH